MYWRISVHVCGVPYTMVSMKYHLSRSQSFTCIRLPIFCLNLLRPLLNLNNMLIVVSDSDLSMVVLLSKDPPYSPSLVVDLAARTCVD